MKGMSIPTYLKIKKAIITGVSVELDGTFFDLSDNCILEKKLKESFCCYDLRIVTEEYKKVTIKEGSIRFAGSEITFCPYCGKKIEVEE